MEEIRTSHPSGMEESGYPAGTKGGCLPSRSSNMRRICTKVAWAGAGVGLEVEVEVEVEVGEGVGLGVGVG